ncbi:3-hydroxyacyl-CoA dehydrogenase NAD-binding domain-containing protein [Gordonia sp. SL306]|uniref:3-hydroxyacyl-CoA dehydrogenase NAD-binding domain-containing protein n=1 Tax=Gordonia sp. SL306 TaxID=2995145 RepID=UPI00226D641B|nr:3-hydroxyacyl-CoA dehydrogenase NAD-binding domain-containing protein [Gordonia sp. SL306]WAC54548.1 3-hydroxyacyl-CoA dehydrogenase NAD-binding domain-containing protein [Gordonia sp. SL306]
MNGQAAAVQRVVVVGAGAIGLSWTALLIGRGVDVVLADPAQEAEERAIRTLTTMLGEVPADLSLVVDAAEAVADADFVIEAGPERLDLKRRLFADLDAAAPAHVMLTSSSSGLAASDIQRDCTRHPERVLVAHPFNPPHLVPLVEVVGGRLTSEESVLMTMEILRGLGKAPIRLRRELPGHVVNRLQAALWREAYYLVEQGVVSVTDIDQAVANGPGLRWALLGPLATQHLSGGDGGLQHVLEHLGPPMLDWWQDLGTPEFTPALIDTLVRGVTEEMGGQEPAVLARRDAALRELLATKAELDLTVMPGAREPQAKGDRR